MTLLRWRRAGIAALAPLTAMLLAACAARAQSNVLPPHELPPGAIAHERWQAQPPLGYAADASRRNLRAGDTLRFRDLAVSVLATDSASGADAARLRLVRGGAAHERTVREGAAFNWEGYHIAVVAVYGPGELGAGLTALEVATVASLPPQVAASTVAGGAALRLRIPHHITRVTLHHTGSAEPLRPEDDPVAKLRGLQSWGASDRNWWDVPYHFLIDLGGRVYEGRDWRFMGETNTTYDPGGHFLISVIGNYERQEATPAQLEAIADLMAWAIERFDVPLDRIGGHYNYAGTSCPGAHLRRYLEDGTFRRMVEERLRDGRAAAAPGDTDVRFLRNMIAHHAQAIVLTDLVAARTSRADLRMLARRIDVSQLDEIRRMQRLLQARGADSARAHVPHAEHESMPGMLTVDELQRLEQADGAAFDSLFLKLMIRHHEGAVTMVADLFAAGAGQGPELFQLASHVDADQRAEIARMQALLTSITRRGGG